MILNYIQKELEEQEYECLSIPASMEFPYSRLMVVLGADKQNRNLMLEIKAIQLQAPPEMEGRDDSIIPFRIQFYVLLPFAVEDEALSQVASLILFLNQNLDLPAFELNELKGEVSYRYVWIMKPSSFDPIVLKNIIGAVVLNVNLFPDIIETLANGKITFNDILGNIIDSVKEIPDDTLNKS